jgi:chromosome segregation ATPase
MENTEYQLQELQDNVYRLNQTVESLAIAVANQQQFINNMIQSINVQIGVLNQISQNVASLENKVNDVDIKVSYTDDSIKEVVDSNNSLSNELQEIKSAIDAVKFYTQTFASATYRQ